MRNWFQNRFASATHGRERRTSPARFNPEPVPDTFQRSSVFASSRDAPQAQHRALNTSGAHPNRPSGAADTASLPDPSWPRGRSYRIRQDWAPNAEGSRQRCITVFRQDEGKIVQVTEPRISGATTWVRITVPRRNVEGYVPWTGDLIEVGPLNAFDGRDQLNIGTPDVFNVSPDPSDSTCTNFKLPTTTAPYLAPAKIAQVPGLSDSHLRNIESVESSRLIDQMYDQGASGKDISTKPQP